MIGRSFRPIAWADRATLQVVTLASGDFGRHLLVEYDREDVLPEDSAEGGDAVRQLLGGFYFALTVLLAVVLLAVWAPRPGWLRGVTVLVTSLPASLAVVHLVVEGVNRRVGGRWEPRRVESPVVWSLSMAVCCLGFWFVTA